MTIRELLSTRFYHFDRNRYRELIKSDLEFLSYFGGRNGTLTKADPTSIEIRYLRCFRKYQANIGNIWGRVYHKRLTLLNQKYGIDFGYCPNFGKGIIIGHWGRIIVHGGAKFGDQIFLTHNVTIGRDVRGKREGVPTIGSRVCIRTNSTVVGNITIGDDVLIAPNTFVNFDVPSHSIVIGNPASIHHRDHATEGHI